MNPIRLLQLEWLKFRKLITFQIMVIAYAVALPSLMLIGKRFPDLPPPLLKNIQLFQFPNIWEYLGYIGNWLAFFFLGFLGVYTITMEFGNKTLRQNIITGLSRSEVFVAKVLFVLAVSLTATLYYALCGFTFGFLHTDVTSIRVVLDGTGIIWRYLLMCIGYMAFGLVIGTLIRRTGIALVLYFAYISFIELIMRWLIHLNIFKNKTMHFYPMNAVEDLVPIPFSDIADGFSQENGFSFFLSPTEAVITVLIYTTLFLFATYRLLKLRDL